MKVKCIYNIDKIKICLSPQNDDFYDKIYQKVKNISDSIKLNYNGFFLRIDENKVNDKDITAILFLDGDNPFELGTFTFNKSAKYGRKCFFSYSSKSLYQCSGYTYSSHGAFDKWNYFDYPFYVFDSLGLKFNNITSIEVALDTDVSVISKIQYAVNNPELYEMILLWKKVDNPDEILEGFWEYYQRSRKRKAPRPTIYIHRSKYESGNRNELKIYDKARELIQSRPDKEEMIRSWNGMGNNIQRLEIYIENKQFRKFFNMLCKKYPDKWCSENTNSKSDEDYKNRLKNFFYDLGMDESYRRILFDYFSKILLHFKCKNHEKTPILISDLIFIPKRILNQCSLIKK